MLFQKIMVGGGHRPNPIIVTNIGTASNTSGATVTLTGVTVPAGALIFVVAVEYIGGTNTTGGSISDATNGSYTAGTALPNGDNPSYVQYRGFGRYYYFPNSGALSGATITYTKNSNNAQAAISAFYATGILATSPLDTAVTASNSDSPSTNPLFTLTSGTPSVAGELMVAVVTTDATGWFVQDTGHGWAVPPISVYTGGTGEINGGTQVNTGTGTKSFSPGNNSGQARNYAAWVLGFKPQ